MRRLLRPSVCLPAVLCLAFSVWLRTAKPSFFPFSAAVLCAGLSLPLWISFGHQLERVWNPLPPAPPDAPQALAPRHAVLWIALGIVLLRLFFYAAHAGMLLLRGEELLSLEDALSKWRHGDAEHYLNIAEHFYTNEGDARLHIVFFPLYPLLVGALNSLLHNPLYAGLLLNLLFSVLGGCALYRLALLDGDSAYASRCVRMLCLLPAFFLTNAPLSDALFFWLSVACILAMRRKQFMRAGVLGMLCAFTRSAGMLLLLPCFLEWLAGLRREHKRGLTLRRAFALNRRGLWLCLIPMGLLAYLAINWAVTGDPFRFMQYQAEHWGQRFGFFFGSAAVHTDYLIAPDVGIEMLLGVNLPNLLFLLGAPLALVLSRRSMRASDLAYFLSYYAFSCGVTWLLSGPRYMTFCYPLALALARLTHSRRVDAALSVSLFLLQMGYLWMYQLRWPVY